MQQFTDAELLPTQQKKELEATLNFSCFKLYVVPKRKRCL